MAKERFRVVADDSIVFGHRTGEEFEVDCEEEGILREALLASGAVELVDGKGPKAKE